MTTQSELRKQRLADLKKRARAGLEDNRSLLHQESRKPKPNGETLTDEVPEDPKEKLMNYTIEQTEKWNELQEHKKLNSEGSGFQNFNQLASMAYKKELQNLPVDKKAYQSQKNHSDIDFTPSAEAKKQLQDAIRQSDKRKQRKKKIAKDSMSINDRNHQFNQKLDRDYK